MHALANRCRRTGATSLLWSLLLAAMPAAADDPVPAGMPAMLHFEQPRFPAARVPAQVLDGYATVVFTVTPAGGVDDALILDASHPAFADALLGVVHSWQLAPAESATTPRREQIRASFKRTGALESSSHYEAAKSAFPDPDTQPPLRDWEQLSAPPAVLNAALPPYPAALRGEHPGGQASVSFYIDPEGKVRVPAVVEATRPEFAAAALSAIAQWRFAPPQQDRRAVIVRTARTFEFGASAPATGSRKGQ